jgi:methylthioribose-1-phosphate isomerase
VGDKVLILETRPYSKTKRWRVSKILEHGVQVEIEVDGENVGGKSE